MAGPSNHAQFGQIDAILASKPISFDPDQGRRETGPEGQISGKKRKRISDAQPNVRIHDLRHTFAATGAGSSLGLPVIGKLLGQSQCPLWKADIGVGWVFTGRSMS
jgi:integrase